MLYKLLENQLYITKKVEIYNIINVYTRYMTPYVPPVILSDYMKKKLDEAINSSNVSMYNGCLQGGSDLRNQHYHGSPFSRSRSGHTSN